MGIPGLSSSSITKHKRKKQETTINNNRFFYGDFEETILYLYQHCIAIQTPINDTTNKPLEFYHFVYQNVYSYLLHYCSFVIITLQYLHIVFLLYSNRKNFSLVYDADYTRE